MSVAAEPAGLAAGLAALALRLLALDPAGSVLVLRAPPGPGRDQALRFLGAVLDARPQRRCPVGIDEDRLLGGLDLTASLSAGRPMVARGLLAECDGGVLVVPGTERLGGRLAALLAAALDGGEVTVERDGVSRVSSAAIGLVLLDEGIDEAPPDCLLDRAAFLIDPASLASAGALPEVSLGSLRSARAQLASVRTSAAVREALCATALAFGIASLRAPLLALRAARGIAALDRRRETTLADAEQAAMLVLAHRATRLPEQPAEASPELPTPSAGEAEQTGSEEALTAGEATTRVLEAARAALPPDLLAALTAGAVRRASAAAGRDGGARPSVRGRRVGSLPGRPGEGRRLDLVSSLRAAAPWQTLRRRQAAREGAEAGNGLIVRPGDLRVLRCEQPRRTTTIFVVDASGSAALNRMAEAKGAVETLLSECYRRRDRVALIGFRGEGAELLLPPTGALARARRCLAALPGGGGTPIAAGLDAAGALAVQLRSRGDTPLIVLLTDGRANVARDGTRDRGRAQADAEASASVLRGAGIAALLIDISPRPQPLAQRLCAAMGGRFAALPQGGQAVGAAVRAAVAA